MIQYPKIPKYGKEHHGENIIAFNKLDGSNLRVEWSRKTGFNKFGTRTRLFDKNDPHFGSAIEIFMNTYSEKLLKVFTDNKEYKNRDQYTLFMEYLGPNSFAGLHKSEDPKEVILFDVWMYKHGLITPKQFIKDFGHLKIPKVIYRGKLTGGFADDVRNGKYNVSEGVVCKGVERNDQVWMVKIKTHSYLKKLQEVYKDNWKDFWE